MKIRSNLLISAGGRSICSEIDWDGSNLPYFGFPAARTEVCAERVFPWIAIFPFLLVMKNPVSVSKQKTFPL